MATAIQEESGCDIYLVLADDSLQTNALALASTLRSAGLGVTFSLTPAKVGKQFKQAEQAGASIALVVGAEFPELSAKILATRAEETLSAENDLVETLLKLLKK